MATMGVTQTVKTVTKQQMQKLWEMLRNA